MSAQSLNQEWFNYPGVKENYRTMVYYPGTGGSTFEFNFEGGYINKEDIKAFMVKDDDREAKYLSLTFKGPNTVQTSEPVPVGWTVCIFRDTPKAEPLAKYQDGAVITAENLDRNAQQAMFAVSEMVDRFDSTVSQVEVALKEVYKATQTADEALAEAKKATGIAQAAVSKADSAIETAKNAEATSKDAQQKAEQASQTATEAKGIANALDGQIKSANATAQAANQTAADAKRIAEGVDGKATQAQSDSAAAVKTATEAKQIAQSIDAKATQAQKDAAEALKKATEVESSVATVQELSKRVDGFEGDAVRWKGSARFKGDVQVRGDGSGLASYSYWPDYLRLAHRGSINTGDWGTVDLGARTFTYNGRNIMYDGVNSPYVNAEIRVKAPAYPRITIEDTDRGYLTHLIQNTDGQPFLEWKERGTLKGQFYIPTGTGTAATREWTEKMIINTGTSLNVRQPGSSNVMYINSDSVCGFWNTTLNTSSLSINGSGNAAVYGQFAASGNIIVRGYQNANGKDSCGIYMASDGRAFVSQYIGGSWRGEINFPKASGTFATEQWVNSQGFVKSSGTQLGPVVTGNSVVLQVADGDGMRVSGYEQMMSQVPGNAVFCGVVFGNIGSRRSGAPKWRVVY